MIADAHSDFLRDLVQRGSVGSEFGKVWLPRLQAGDVRLQVAVVNSPALEDPVAAADRQLRALGELADAYRDAVELIRHADELEPTDGRMKMVLAMEGAEPLVGDPDALPRWWEAGMRILGITWNQANAFADGNAAAEPGSGLTEPGRELVDDFVGRGGIIDLAHASRQTFDDVLELLGNRRPLLSHVGCRALIDNPRNVADDQLRELADRDGLVGIFAVGPLIHAEHPDLDRVVDHVEHAAGIVGVERVCLAGDFTRELVQSGALHMPAGLITNPALPSDGSVVGLEGPEHYPDLDAVLERRGWSETDRESIGYRNLHRFLLDQLPAAPPPPG